jgi:hypothetical protein
MEELANPENEAEVATFYRLTLDLRLLNNITIADRHPMPQTADVINQLRGKTHYSCFDIQDAFWCMKLAEQDRYKTAFATHNGHYHRRVMPQGGKNCAVVWARLVRQILTPSTPGIEIYQDDVFNCTNGIKEHLKIMQMTFDKIREHRLVFKRSKAKLNYHRIKCLGHLITARGRVADPGLIQAVLDFKPPKTKQHVQVFLGMANYNRDYIPRITDMTGVLQELTLKDVNIPEVWRDDVHGAAFRRLSQASVHQGTNTIATRLH